MSTGGTVVDEPIDCASAPSSQPDTPTSKVKFSCCYGGKILPRPGNGHLKYVGGETRVISVPIDITFQDLMKKLTYLMDGEMTLKYQIVPEELETLVTVKTDEDLKLMFDLCSSYDMTGTSRLRTFLFPKKSPLDIGSMDPQPSVEQRYIDAINGIVRPPTICQLAINTNSSASIGSSPAKSPENSETLSVNNGHSDKGGMQRVRSSPSLYSLGKQEDDSPQTPNFQYIYHNHRQQSNFRGGPPEKLISVSSLSRAERARYQVGSFQQYPQYPSGLNRYHGGCRKFTQCDEHSPYMRRERPGSLPVSPIQRSPRGSQMRKVWETPSTGD